MSSGFRSWMGMEKEMGAGTQVGTRQDMEACWVTDLGIFQEGRSTGGVLGKRDMSNLLFELWGRRPFLALFLSFVAVVTFALLITWGDSYFDPFGWHATDEAVRGAREECALDCFPLDVARSRPGQCFCDVTAVSPKGSQ